MTKYLLVDAMNLAHRAMHVTTGDSYEKAGLSISILINSIRSAWNRFEADHVVFALDSRSWRKDVYSAYKSNRAVKKMQTPAYKLDDEKIFQDVFNDFVEFVRNYTRVTVLQQNKCEADDFIARFIKNNDNGQNQFVIVSSDSDFIQLISDTVSIFDGVQKKIITSTGVFEEDMKPFKNKKNELVELPNPEYVLFEKCIRGDKSDNIASAYPGVREKGTSKKVGIIAAFEDRVNQGYDWVQFMKSRWTDIEGVEHVVEEDYKRNLDLIDLTRQPDSIKQILDETIEQEMSKPRTSKDMLFMFNKFCKKHELNKIGEYPESYLKIFNAGVPNV